MMMIPYQRKETIGDCTLYLGNAYEILPHIGFFDALVTDPPYVFETSGGGIFRRKRHNMDEIKKSGLDKGFDFTTLKAAQFGSVVMFCHNDQLVDLLPYILAEWGRYALCAWHKSNPMPVANKHYKPDTEFYIHGWRQGFQPVGALAQKDRYIIHPNGQDRSIAHPTVKPLAVMAKIISNINGDAVCDPFMGSGTTALACVRAGKKFVGIECNVDFFNIAVGRIRTVYDQMELFSADRSPSPQQMEALL